MMVSFRLTATTALRVGSIMRTKGSKATQDYARHGCACSATLCGAAVPHSDN